MLLEILALILICAGVFLLFKGLTEEPEGEIFPTEIPKEEIRRDVKAGGVVLIGPVPIVFGESRMAVYALILTIVLMVLVFLLMFMPYLH